MLTTRYPSQHADQTDPAALILWQIEVRDHSSLCVFAGTVSDETTCSTLLKLSNIEAGALDVTVTTP